jgi:hypothetical protein
MGTFTSISDLIAAWPKRAALADDINVTVDRVHKWAQANTIPARYQQAVIDAALARGIDLTADELVRLNAGAFPAPKEAAE